MPYLRYIFFQITLLVTNNVLAQESDTIYIHQDPLIVKKQVVMEVPETKATEKKHPWFVAIDAGFGAYNSPSRKDSLSITLTSIFAPSIQLGRQHKNWTFSTGIGRAYSQLSARLTSQMQKTVEISPMKKDTTGSYEQNGITHYFIDTIPAKYSIEKYDTNTYASFKISYWTIPFKVGYRYPYKKCYILPQLGMVYHFRSQSDLESPLPALPKSYWSASVELKAGVLLDKNWALELGVSHIRQISKVISNLKLHQSLVFILLRRSF